MKKIFSIAALGLALMTPWAHAQEGTEPEVYGRIAKSLQQARQTIDQNKSADSQAEVFEKALDLQCDSRTNEVAVPPAASDAEKLRNYQEFLDQFILLSDRLIVVDSGKRGMDCYGSYYIDYAKQVEGRLKLLPEEMRKRLQEETDRYLKATGQKPKKTSAASGSGSSGKR